MVETPTPRSWFRLPAPRFSLRALLGAVLLIGVAIPLGQRAWRRYVAYRDARQYAAMQNAKNWQLGRPGRAIDGGRGIPDDYVILVRRGNTFGCFNPRNQFKRGESVEYDWYYRADGGGKFDPGDPNVKSGHGFSGVYVPGSGQMLAVSFGPFEIEWSGGGPGWGFLYHDVGALARMAPPPLGVLRICTTDVKDVKLIDARDPRWIYKCARADPGMAGDKDAGEWGVPPASAEGVDE